jgi:hypothetical protein
LPDAKLIVMLRNPVDLAISMHSQALRSRDEDVVDFADAWTLCADRRAGRKTPLRGRDHKILLYDTLPLLGQQLQRLLQTFPETQVRWWFYDDFASDPAQIYREVLAFLDVEHDGRDAFPLVNPRRHARSQSLAQFTQKTPKPLVRAAMYAKRRIGIQRLGVLDALRSVNFVRGKQAIAPALMEEMRVHFTPDIRLLESITGRSLAHWRGAAA